MKRRTATLTLSALLAAGCETSRPATAPIVLSQRTVTVSADDPFISMDDGSKIPVDGLSTGQTMRFTVTEYRNRRGQTSVDVQSATESNSKVEPP